jgi:glyoxylate reductase
MRKKVFITRRSPDEGINLLREKCDVTVSPHDKPMPRTELLSAVKGTDAVLTQLVDKVDEEFFRAAQGVKVVANYAVGVDNIDLTAAKEQGVVVTNTPGVLTLATAELAWTLLFAAARRVPEGDAMTRQGRFQGWGPLLLLGQDVFGKTLGIVGSGRIGTAMALMSKGFGMRVIYRSRKTNETLEKELGAKRVELEELLRESDFISLHTSLAPETKHLIGRAELAQMKPTAVLINTARGPVVDETALVEALREGKIFSAGLDVYEKEPALAGGLADLPNAVLLPHVGSATVDTRKKMAALAAENIIAVLEGRPPRTPVSR